MCTTSWSAGEIATVIVKLYVLERTDSTLDDAAVLNGDAVLNINAVLNDDAMLNYSR